MAGLTSGVTVTLSATENGTATVGANVASFSDIENFVLTAQNDVFNGTAATGALTLDGGAGADSLTGGSANDSLTGGAGNDSLNGGAGNDSLLGGDGNDVFVLTDGFGTDAIFGGSAGETTGDVLNLSALTSGVTVILSATENGIATVGANVASFSDIENFVLTAQNDLFNGTAATGALILDGGAGADSLIGGSANDSLTGGTGHDTLNGGLGADLLLGGDDADVFFVDVGDTVYGGAGGADLDTLDLRNWGKARTDIVYDPGSPENGTVTFYDPFGVFLGTMRFENIENVIPCFTPGTTIDTNRGAVAVEDLVVGDWVLTRDNGFQAVRWAGAKRLAAADLQANPALQPVLIRQGTLGHGLPLADMRVSPQHRMLLTGPRAELLFGEAEVLAPALHLVGIPGVERAQCEGVTYLHVMFDQHEIICANGAWSESFQPGDRAMAGLGVDTCAELVTLFPELATAAGRNSCRAARLSLKPHEVRALLAA